jgi:Carboxypeptidase Taq (M32) metallopeptidase
MSATPENRSALERLRARLAELADLAAIKALVEWDQLVMMPARGAPARAHQLGALARTAHERATAEEIGACLRELEGAEFDELDCDLVRVARRDWERARRVPEELAAEIARASAEGQEVWQRARAADDFAAFAPGLERNVALARATVDRAVVVTGDWRQTRSQPMSKPAAYSTHDARHSILQAFPMIGETGFEPATARPPAGCATRLRHSPWCSSILGASARENVPGPPSRGSWSGAPDLQAFVGPPGDRRSG